MSAILGAVASFLGQFTRGADSTGSAGTSTPTPVAIAEAPSSVNEAVLASASEAPAILCLHGIHQRSQYMESQLAWLEHACRGIGVDLIYIDAPISQPARMAPHGRAWFSSNAFTWGPKPSEAQQQAEYAVTLRLLAAVCRHRHVVGIFGFSMGCIVAADVLGRADRFPDGPFGGIAFGIFTAGGFVTQVWKVHEDGGTYAAPPNPVSGGTPFKKPALIFGGRWDCVFPLMFTRYLANYFQDATVLSHAGGHVPLHEDVQQQVLEFIQAHLPAPTSTPARLPEAREPEAAALAAPLI